MYMIDMNRRFVHRFRSKMYIPVSYTNRQSYKNTNGVGVNRLVGMGLKGLPAS